MRLKPAGKLIILIVVLGVAFGAYRMYTGGGFAGLIPGKEVQASSVPVKADLPDINFDNPAPGSNVNVAMPGSSPGCTDEPEMRFLLWAWNSQMGLMFANGGQQAAQNSLMCANDVNLKLIRQDDPTKMQEELVTFAQELKRGTANPTKGAHFVAIMGDGSAAFLKGVNDTLKRLGPEYMAKVVGSCGYSVGEDKFMGPQSWKSNPAASRGGVVSGYLRDGDWNIAMKWLADNGLKNNPDETTWDPDALNWVAANDYVDAAEKYIAGYSETRDVVRNGKRTGEKKRITVNGVVTWTPGDVSVASKKGGLVSIVSTKEYSSQMPNTIIGIDKWMRANPKRVEGMLSAIFRGSESVRSSESALQKAGGISSEVYGEQDADYWVKYYKGVQEMDKTGMEVDLGGSRVNTLSDNLLLFGMVPGSANLFAATYQVFGDIVKDQYPNLMPNYYPITRILDTRYVAAIAKRAGGVAKVDTSPIKNTFKPTAGRSNPVISRRSWNIQFATGQAQFTQSARNTLSRLLKDLLIASGTIIEIHGHTDSVG
ncbi:MAG: hypothetical protein ACAH95_13455, partial [Fimbriimonas sp.]